MRRLKLLVSAYACEPGKGSEGGVGWNVAQGLARYHDVWVITRRNNRDVIEEAQRRAPTTHLHFVYHDLRLRGLKKLPGGVRLYHYLWQLSLRSMVIKLNRNIRFDVAHQLTFGSVRYPSALHVSGIPVVIGPVGGAEMAPVSFWPAFGMRGFLSEAFRALSNGATRFDPLVRRSYRRAAAVLAASAETARFLRHAFGAHANVQVLPSIGIDAAELQEYAHHRLDRDEVRQVSTGFLKVLFAGRLVHWKGAHLAVKAFAELLQRHGDAELTILGAGPQAARLQRLSRQLGIQSSVRFLSRLPSLHDVYHLYAQHDVFLFPSLHESGGMVVIEAMAIGLPIVCLDLGGPTLSVTRDSGFLIKPTNPRQTVQDLSAALIRLATDHGLRVKMGEAARARVAEHYTWGQKSNFLASLYCRLAESNESR
ncbi:MAG: glycosyltransferase family 4 protein [Symbiobacteriia bacterium]